MTTVRVSTPSRLHFGLLRLHESAERCFGGLGMMIDRPRVELEVSTSRQWRVTGPEAARATEFARMTLDSINVDQEVDLRPAAIAIKTTSVVPQHRGLGGGTQLALAIAAAVRELAGLPRGTAAELASAVGRGARSAIGSHGFAHGGLLWERGRTFGSTLAELAERVELPVQWRVVLISPPRRYGLSGAAEQMAFDRLPRTPSAVTSQLESIAEGEVLPAAKAANCDAFGEAVYRYGRLAGECFSSVQGGPYASSDIAACVTAIRDCGVTGAGQSSWGPTVFAITPSASAADELVAKLRCDQRWSTHDVEVAAADNRGATVARV